MTGIKLGGREPLKMKWLSPLRDKAIISIKEANRLLSKYASDKKYPIIDYDPEYNQSKFAFEKDELLRKNNYTIRFIELRGTPFLLQLFKKKALLLSPLDFSDEYNDKKF